MSKPWLRGRKISRRKLQQLRGRLSRKLHKEAFDAYFECCDCGAHKDLQAHHLAYDEGNFDNPAWYVIVCPKHHAKRHRKH